MLAEKNYVLPTEVESAVVARLNETYWVDPFDDNPDPKQEKMFEQAHAKVERLKHRYTELSKEIPCMFRELTREEKATFEIPLRSRKKYFIRP